MRCRQERVPALLHGGFYPFFARAAPSCLSFICGVRARALRRVYAKYFRQSREEKFIVSTPRHALYGQTIQKSLNCDILAHIVWCKTWKKKPRS
jgi:hypothetical protein